MSSRFNNSSKHQTIPVSNSVSLEQKANREYLEDDDDDIDDNDDYDEFDNEEEDGDEFEDNGGLQFSKVDFEDDNEENDFENKNEEEEEDEDDEENHKNQKKRKLKSLLAVASSYEFAPRVRTPMPETGATKKRIFGARNAVADWSEHETFILLDAWGDKFLQHGRKSLWSEEWREVAKIVSQKSNRTDYQCRNRLDTLKKKYKKEKAKMIQNKRFTSTWMYFKRMDSLMSLPARQAGVDSGEHTKRANGFHEMDSQVNSDHEDTEGNDSGKDCSLKLIADSINKFCRVYEKIEKRKRLQMLELEEMRMKFRREMESKKMQIFERAWTEIVDTCRRKDEENNDLSDEDTCG